MDTKLFNQNFKAGVANALEPPNTACVSLNNPDVATTTIATNVAKAQALTDSDTSVYDDTKAVGDKITCIQLGEEGQITRDLVFVKGTVHALSSVVEVNLSDCPAEKLLPVFNENNIGTPQSLHMFSLRSLKYDATGGRVMVNQEEICNAEIIPICKIMHVVNAEGEKEWAETEFAVYLKTKTVLISCNNADIDSIHKQIRKRNPDFYIGDICELGKYVRTQLEQYAAKMKEVTICNIPGWVSNGHSLYYNSAKLPNAKISRKLLEVDEEFAYEIISDGISFLKIGNANAQISTLFVAAHIAYLTPWLEKIKHPAKFLVCLVGQSNSLKTSVVRELFNLFVPDGERLFSFQSTSKGLELAASEARHETFVVDDVAPASASNAKSNESRALANVERLSRIFSDDSVMTKSSPNWSKTLQLAPKGLCVITAEFLAGSLSTRSRQLWIKCDRKTFVGAVLRGFQTNPQVMQEYFSLFVQYLEDNQAEITALLEAGIESYGSKIADIWDKINTPRAQENLRVLLATIAIISHFVGIYGVGIDVQKLIHGVSTAILDSDTEVEAKNPVNQFLNNLELAVEEGYLLCSENKYEFALDTRNLLVDREKSCIWAHHKEFYKVVYDFASEVGDPIAILKTPLQKLLKDNEHIICDSTGYTQKSGFNVGTKRKHLVCIPLDSVPRIKNILEDVKNEQ